MSANGGWYVDPKNPARDAYWTGHIWSGANRATEEGTPTFPGEVNARPEEPPAGSWKSWANAMYVICGLAVLGTLIGGIALMLRTGQTCTANPYDETIVDCANTHPFVVTGVVVLVAGLVNALVIFAVGRLCDAQSVPEGAST